jgi:protein arginine kinase activator
MPERPVECSHCKKSVKVVYKEISGDSIVTSEMCEDCPILKQKLHGETALIAPTPAGAKVDGAAGLCCGICRTTLESVKMGNPLGCSECYVVFADQLFGELAATDKIAPRLKKILESKKTQPLLHVGKSPTKNGEIAPSSRITALNEALNEALRKENYEEAARLRDQIKDLMERK